VLSDTDTANAVAFLEALAELLAVPRPNPAEQAAIIANAKAKFKTPA